MQLHPNAESPAGYVVIIIVYLAQTLFKMSLKGSTGGNVQNQFYFLS